MRNTSPPRIFAPQNPERGRLAWCLSAALGAALLGACHSPTAAQAPAAPAVSAVSAAASAARSDAPDIRLSERPHEADLSPHGGEILVEGKLLAVDAVQGTLQGTLTVGVTSFSLPNGSSKGLNVPRPKAIVVSDLTLLHVRGNPARLATLAQLKDEVSKAAVFVAAIGADAGNGRPLPARRVAVWSRVANRAFFEALPEPPPGERNELADGGFEDEAQGSSAQWTLGRSARREQDKEGNHFAVVAVGGEVPGVPEVPEAERKIKTYLAVDSSWKAVRVSARMRLSGTQPGQEGNAHLGVVYYGAGDKYLGLGPVLTPAQDSEWATLSGTGDVPDGTRKLMLDAGVYGPSGALSVDEVRVVANPRLASGPLRPGFPEGTFEQVDAHGLPRGWNVADSRLAQVLAEKGNRFLRLTNSDPARMLAVDASFPLPPGARQMVLRYRARARNLKVGGQEPFQNARVGYLFTDARGRKVGDWPPTPGLREDSDWTWIEVKAAVPPDAVLLKISPVLHNAAGILDVDDIQIEVH